MTDKLTDEQLEEIRSFDMDGTLTMFVDELLEAREKLERVREWANTNPDDDVDDGRNCESPEHECARRDVRSILAAAMTEDYMREHCEICGWDVCQCDRASSAYKIEETDSDIVKFESFFKAMGVPYSKNFGHEKLSDESGKDILSITQCHLHFFENVFIGAEADEMGFFVERIMEAADD